MSRFFIIKQTTLLYGIIFQVKDQISKIVASHFKEHKKLGRQPNFQKFLAPGGHRNLIRRLIGGCEIFYSFKKSRELIIRLSVLDVDL